MLFKDEKKLYLINLIRGLRGHMTRMSRASGIPRATLYKWIQRDADLLDLWEREGGTRRMTADDL